MNRKSFLPTDLRTRALKDEKQQNIRGQVPKTQHIRCFSEKKLQAAGEKLSYSLNQSGMKNSNTYPREHG
ncbi:MAG TPA: hypothetical protein O0W88_04260, partial [Methanocorpusculum sp.]|nr:hypothetical protein [Methanocorpusculum sp.]